MSDGSALHVSQCLFTPAYLACLGRLPVVPADIVLMKVEGGVGSATRCHSTSYAIPSPNPQQDVTVLSAFEVGGVSNMTIRLAMIVVRSWTVHRALSSLTALVDVVGQPVGYPPKRRRAVRIALPTDERHRRVRPDVGSVHIPR